MASALKNTNIDFLFYEPVDQWGVAPILRQLKASGFHTQITDGFSYDRYIQKTKHPKFFRKSFIPFSYFKKPASRTERIFSFLLKTKAASMETRIVLKQVMWGRKILLNLFRKKKPNLIVIPETIRAAHGKLALEVAREFKIKTCVVPPLYYEWVATRPLSGNAPAHQWIVSSKFYARRLKGAGVQGKISPVLCAGKYLKQYVAMSQPRRKQSPSGVQKKIIVATLQNNPHQDLFLSLLTMTFARLPGENLWIKFHPTTPAAVKKKIQARYQSNNTFFSEESMTRLFSKARAFITVSSTSALLAVYYRVPVIVTDLDFFFHELGALMDFYGCFTRISNPDELFQALSRIKNEKTRATIIKRQESLRKDFFKSVSTNLISRALLDNPTHQL